MRVFAAMLVDAYHQLNSRKLFWVVLAISGLVVLAYGSIGFHEDGMSILYGLKHFESEYLTRDSPISQMIYRTIFAQFIVGIWLSWAATILALISTTTIFPDFMADGAIELVLAKPVHRITLFVHKYITSLLFMVLQVALFSLGVFLCLGLRLGDWDWKIFLAIPILTVFFSYLYAVNVLIGVWTRSALAALLLTMLLWVSLFSITATEAFMSHQRIMLDIRAEEQKERIAGLQERLESFDDADPPAASDDPRRGQLEFQITDEQDTLATTEESIAALDKWHTPVRGIMVMLPKTSETVDLLDRALRRESDVNLFDVLTGNVVPDDEGGFRPKMSSTDREIAVREEAQRYSRSLWYVVGTSVAFELVVLTIAGTMFVRRDF